jgi:nitrogen regulatory protein PII
MVLHDMTHFGELMSAWQDAGAPAVTILEGLGTREPKEQARRELPLMPSVRDVLHAEDMPRTTMISVVPDDVADRLAEATEQVLGDLSEPGKGIFFVVPVTRVLGLRPPPHSPAP